MIQTGLTGCPLDRADAARNDPAAVAAAFAHPESQVLRLGEGGPDIEAGGLRWHRLSEPLERLALLGFDAGRPRFVALDGGLGGAMRDPPLWTFLSNAPAADAAIFGLARTLVDWHRRHGFCANCGVGTAPFRAGWARRCDACGTEHYPRVDPVVIMLVEHRDRVLVGRGKGWGPTRGSALAGFVEPGESIEEAVAREVQEETGVRVTAVRYAASQPWPFPGQLMIACFAETDNPALTIDANELDDAFWVDRDGIAAMLDRRNDAPFQGPPPHAIAHTLFRLWLEQRAPA